MIRIREGVNLLEQLKDKGLTAYAMRKQRILGESRIQRLRRGQLPSWHELDLICRITGATVGELIEYAPDPEA